jgi:hypothetical protein
VPEYAVEMPAEDGSGPHLLVDDMVLQICRQLRDIAAGIEILVGLLASQAPDREGSTAFSHNARYREVLAEIHMRLEPVAAVMQSSATSRPPRPLPAYSVPAAAQSA